MDIVKRSGLLIPKKYSYREEYVKVKEELQRRTRAYGNSTYIDNIFYLESEKFLLIPRNFPLQKYFTNVEIHDHRHEGQQIEITHNITPRNEVQKKAIEYLLSHEDGIIQLSPGVGKTVISIYVIATRKVKSLILVHRDSLADQWKDRIKTFTNLKDSDIARLTSQRFEEDLKKPIIIATTQTFISLLKRNRGKFLIALNDANIGLFIGDEVHTSVGAPTFSECSIHIASKYTYGLSATPYRHDGNGDIIEYHLGQVYSDSNKAGTMSCNVSVILLDYQIDTQRRYRYIHWGGQFQKSRYLNMMKKSNNFMNIVKGLLMKLKDDRDFLCIVERINLIEELYNWIPSNSKSKFCGNEKLDMLEYKHTFSTPGKCRDGVDAPWKDCVIMTSPITNIEQLAGRVVRSHKNKQTPIIIDMVDFGCKNIAFSFNNRRKYYESKGWKIQYILCIKDQLKMIDFETANTIVNGES